MAMPWEGIVSADEIAAYEAAGFGRPQAQGKRPALLIIDVQYRTVGTQRQPFWESIKEFKTSCGEVGWKAVDHIAPLLARFREKNLPVLYPYVAPKENFDVGRLAEKVPALMGVAANGYQFVPEIAPRERDVLRCLLQGKNPKAIAAELGITDKTLYAHRAHIMQKTQARSHSELQEYALSLGLI